MSRLDEIKKRVGRWGTLLTSPDEDGKCVVEIHPPINHDDIRWLVGEVERLMNEVAAHTEVGSSLAEELRNQAAQVERLQRMLAKVEWKTDSGHPYCQFCGSEDEPLTHRDGCEWVKAMGRSTTERTL